jgi:hypothetical protein
MNLHQQAESDVRRLVSAHRSDFSIVRGCLDMAVQETGGYWEHPNPEFLSIDASVRAGHIKQLAAGFITRRKVAKAVAATPPLPTLRLRIRGFAGLHLYTPDGQRIRTRLRPVTGKNRSPMHASQGDSDALFEYDEVRRASVPKPLFGHDAGAKPYEVSILMDIDLGTKTLKAAWLAAIDWGPHDRGRVIYYEEEIPAPPMAGTSGPDGGTPVPPGAGGPPEDGFGDFLGQEGEETGTDPA